MLLADFQLPDSNSLMFVGGVVFVLASLLSIIRNGIGLRQDLRDRPTGAEALATAQENFATQDALASLEGKIESQRKESESSRARIYDHIDEVRKELDHNIKTTSKELGDKIDRLPDKVIVTLKNTGAI